MKNYSIQFSGEAEEDVTAGYSWYEKEKLVLGELFFNSIGSGIKVIKRNPGAYRIRYWT